MSDIKERGKITSDGKLLINGMIKVCPFANPNSCGDWCMLFGSPKSYFHDTPMEKIQLMLHCGAGRNFIFNSFEDVRRSYV